VEEVHKVQDVREVEVQHATTARGAGDQKCRGPRGVGHHCRRSGGGFERGAMTE